RVGDLDLQCNGLQGSGDPKLRAKLERAQMQQRATEGEYADVRARLRDADAQWFNAWRAACDVFQVLEEERVEYLKTALWAYTNLVSGCCVADDESMERIRQDLEKISVADDIAAFIRTFGTGSPDPELARAADDPAHKPPADDGDDSDGGGRPARAQPQKQQQQQQHSAIATPANTNTANINATNSVSNNTVNSVSTSSGTARSGSIMAHPLSSRPQTQESMRYQQQNQPQMSRPASMHAAAPQMPPMANNRPPSAMHDNTYRRASNNDMYAMANNSNGAHPQQQQQYVQRTNSQMTMRAAEPPNAYMYMGVDPRAQSSMGVDPRTQSGMGVDPRAQSSMGVDPRTQSGMGVDPRTQSSMGAYRANGGTHSPVMVSGPQQHRPGTPGQMPADAYGMPPRMESPRSRASTFNGPPHTGNFGTLTGTAQMQPFHPHRAPSPGSPYQQQQQQPSPQQHMGGSRPSSAMGSPHLGNPRPGSAMQQQPPPAHYVMSQPQYRSATPVQQQQQPQYVSNVMSRPPTQMSHSPAPQIHPQMSHSPQMLQRAPSAMAAAPQMMAPQQRPMSRVEQPANSTSESGKEILFYVKVLYDYDADNDKELTIREGDVISVLAVSADGWWEGEMTDRRSGRPMQGTFPSNFTDPISNLISQ
ncbi:formin-binding protein, partial [Coemansia sp. RSA 2705]